MCVCFPPSFLSLYPQLREAWKAHAAQQGGRGAYLRFANMLINDSIYLLDESLKYVKVGAERVIRVIRGDVEGNSQAVGTGVFPSLLALAIFPVPATHKQAAV